MVAKMQVKMVEDNIRTAAKEFVGIMRDAFAAFDRELPAELSQDALPALNLELPPAPPANASTPPTKPSALPDVEPEAEPDMWKVPGKGNGKSSPPQLLKVKGKGDLVRSSSFSAYGEHRTNLPERPCSMYQSREDQVENLNEYEDPGQRRGRWRALQCLTSLCLGRSASQQSIGP